MTLIFTPAAERELRTLYSASSRSLKNAITTLLTTLDDAPEYPYGEAQVLPPALDDAEDRPQGASSVNRSTVRADGGIVWVLWRQRRDDAIEIVGALRAE